MTDQKLSQLVAWVIQKARYRTPYDRDWIPELAIQRVAVKKLHQLLREEYERGYEMGHQDGSNSRVTVTTWPPNYEITMSGDSGTVAQTELSKKGKRTSNRSKQESTNE